MGEHKIRIMPYGKFDSQEFTVRPNELVLDAAFRQDVKIPYSCRNGTCRTCIVQVTEGSLIQEDAEFCMISLKELQMNRRLICMSTAKTDAVIEKIAPRQGRQNSVTMSYGKEINTQMI